MESNKYMQDYTASKGQFGRECKLTVKTFKSNKQKLCFWCGVQREA